MHPSLSAYIHWPFCKSKCPYCDFNSHVRDGVDAEAWQAAMLAELDHMASLTGQRTVTSVFFGGGTPSLMPPAIVEALLNRLSVHYTIDPNIEITLEANPTSVEMAKLEDFKAAGINRVSLGIQSLRADDLRFLGREHSAKEALQALKAVQALFDRSSFDLIYARPGQTPASWEAELKEALSYSQGHLSLYQLTIEPETPFARWHKAKRFQLPAEEHTVQLYEVTHSLLEAAGMPAYEVSNHAAPGQESRHNLAYWQARDWIGIGPGAYGRFFHAQQQQRVETHTQKSPERWLAHVQTQGHGTISEEAIDAQSYLEEALMMGLRLTKGVHLPTLQTQLGMQWNALWHAIAPRITHCQKDGLLQQHQDYLHTTPQGRLLLNHVLERILA